MIYAEELCLTTLHPSFTVKGQLFSDSPKASQGTIGFPFALELIVSDTTFEKNVLYLSHLKKNIFSKRYDKHVILVASVRALTGTKGSFVMYPTTNLISGKQIVGVVDFEKSTQYLHQHEILLNSLPVGSYMVKYYLNELCWASTTFEVVE
jgi:hypothetical protein